MVKEFFSAFPTTKFNDVDIKNITVRLDILKRIKNNTTIFQYKLLKDGQRPEDVAQAEYGDPRLYWIILYINDIIDPYYDWLLTEDRLYEYVERKYTTEKINAVHHYVTNSNSEFGEGIWVDFGTPFSSPVTNLQYEQSVNEEKRKIKILKTRYIPQILSEYQSELSRTTND